MASNNTTTTGAPATSENTTTTSTAAKSVQKRYEGLVMVRTKAVKGKGAWYWAHLEPILVHHQDTGLPKAVKLRCSLCDAVFSASNPSRTASEHLKRGTCPNFNSSSSSSSPRPISAVSPARKRQNPSPSPLAMIEPAPVAPMALSGGKDDLAPLAMLEDSVKRLKSPKMSPGPALSRAQAESAVELFSDWVYESCGAVSLSSLESPKFKAFLHQVGVPAAAVSRRELLGSRLDSRFDQARAESEARIRDAMFFQLASAGWRRNKRHEQGLVNLAVNLPNGTSVYRRGLFVSGDIGTRYAEDVMWETLTAVGSPPQRCVGIVSDRFKSKALRNLEAKNQWMVNLPCLHHTFKSLLRDFSTQVPLAKTAVEDLAKVVSCLNENSNLRTAFLRFQTNLIRLNSSPELGFRMLGEALACARAVQIAFKSLEPVASDNAAGAALSEATGLACDASFWNRIEAAHALLRTAAEAAETVGTERPLVARCLPLWEETRAKVREWILKYSQDQTAEQVLDRRFRKSYHAAWAAAMILDPLYLTRDASGKYLPAFKKLNGDQERDVDRLITRLVSREEAHIVLMELMKWRTEGLDPVYARAVQMRERDPVSGAMRVANPQSGRLVWETHLTHFAVLPKVAVRLIFLRATVCGVDSAPPLVRWVTPAAVPRAEKLVFVAAHLGSVSGDDDDNKRILAEEIHNGGEDEEEEEDDLHYHHQHQHQHHNPHL